MSQEVALHELWQSIADFLQIQLVEGIAMRHPMCPIVIGLLVVAGCATKTQPQVSRLFHGRYLLTDTGQYDSFTEPGQQKSIKARLFARMGTGDQFIGTDRGDAKTSIAPGDPETFTTVAKLRSSLLSDDKVKDKGITKDFSSPRIAEEEHNVRIVAYIYALKKEANDNDFHLIIGDNGCGEAACLMTAEVSGLPSSDAGDYEALGAARQRFLTYFGEDAPRAGSGYTKSEPGIRVTITGSLFFDVDHAAGAVGPEGLRPDSAWEIHPVTSIIFPAQ
jgi:hypothetical protein